MDEARRVSFRAEAHQSQFTCGSTLRLLRRLDLIETTTDDVNAVPDHRASPHWRHLSQTRMKPARGFNGPRDG